MKIAEIDKEVLEYIVDFGKVYNGRPLKELLADEKYCSFLLGQAWFEASHPSLFALIKKIDRHSVVPTYTETCLVCSGLGEKEIAATGLTEVCFLCKGKKILTRKTY